MNEWEYLEMLNENELRDMREDRLEERIKELEEIAANRLETMKGQKERIEELWKRIERLEVAVKNAIISIDAGDTADGRGTLSRVLEDK